MDNNQIMMKDKLGVYGIAKQALKISTRNLNFVTLALVTSFPLFLLEIFSQLTTFPETLRLLITAFPISRDPYMEDHAVRTLMISYSHSPIHRLRTYVRRIMEDVSRRFILSGLISLSIGHLLGLLSAIILVHSASDVYAGRDAGGNLQEMLIKPLKKGGLRGPLITWICACALASLTLTGLLSFAVQGLMSQLVIKVIFGLAFCALLAKYLEWGAVWNVGLVFSILEGKHGDVGIGLSAYISKGSRKRGLLLMLVFLAWNLVLRFLTCLVIARDQGSSGFVLGITIGQACLICLGDVLKWVVFVVYFYDCKKRFLEKKVDVEQVRSVATS